MKNRIKMLYKNISDESLKIKTKPFFGQVYTTNLVGEKPTNNYKGYCEPWLDSTLTLYWTGDGQ